MPPTEARECLSSFLPRDPSSSGRFAMSGCACSSAWTRSKSAPIRTRWMPILTSLHRLQLSAANLYIVEDACLNRAAYGLFRRRCCGGRSRVDVDLHWKAGLRLLGLVDNGCHRLHTSSLMPCRGGREEQCLGRCPVFPSFALVRLCRALPLSFGYTRQKLKCSECENRARLLRD